MRKILLAGIAVAGTLSIPTAVLVSTATPASANPPVVCKKIKGTISGTVTISKCKVPKADKKTYKTLTGSSTQLATGGTLTWHKSGATTIINAPTLGTGTKCPAADTDETASGMVTGGTSVITGAGDPYSGEFCITPAGNITLPKGGSFTL